MINDLDDYLFDVMKGQQGVPLTPAIMNDLIEHVMQLARRHLAR